MTKQPRLVGDQFAQDQGYTITRSEGWYLVRHITKSDDGTVNSELQCEVVLCPSTGHLNEDETARGSFQQDGVTAHIATARCVRGQNHF
jgi:hypothetical protein